MTSAISLRNAIATFGIWLALAALTVSILSPVTRLLAFALATGALLIAAIYEANKKDRNWKRIVVLFSTVWFVCGLTVLAANRLIPPAEEPKGPLVAGSSPAPMTACGGAPKDGLLMIVGKNGVIGHGLGPFTPFRAGSCPAVSITRTAQGLLVNAFGYDSDNNVVYRVHDNVFNQVLGGYTKAHRPDTNSLVIAEDRKEPSLEIRYLNKNTVRISGTFRCGDSKPLRITETDAFLGGGAIKQSRCVTLGKESPNGLVF